MQLPGALLISKICTQAVRRALEEIVLKKRPPVVPKVPPKPRQIQAPQPSKPGQRQLELVYVHECRCFLPPISDNHASPPAEHLKQVKAITPVKDVALPAERVRI